MSVSNDRFRVNIGMSVVKDEFPGYGSFGLTYHNMPYADMVRLEAIFDKHADSIIEALGPLREDLVNIGMQFAQDR